MYLSVLLISVIGLVGASATEIEKPAGGDAAPIESLGLKDARQMAFERNWDLLAAKSNIDQATAQKVIAREFPNPSIAFNTTKINADGRTNATEKPLNRTQQALQASGQSVTPALRNGLWHRSYDTLVAVSQLFELGGKRGYRIASAQAGIEQAEAQFKDAKRTLDTAVVKGYAAVLLAESNAKTLADSAASMRKEAELAAVREKAGDISSTDRKQIEVAADKLEADALAAVASARTARIQLLTLVGCAEPNADWIATDELDKLAAVDPPKPDQGNDRRPDLVAAEAGLKKAEADLRGQKALWVPDPTVTINYEHEPPDGPNSVGVGVSVPIPAWHRFKGEVSAAETARNDALREIHRIQAQIVSDRNQAATVYANAVERWRSYKTNMQPKSAQVKESVSYAYEKGGASLLDLLSAQRTDNDVRLSTAQAAGDTVNALADLASVLNVELKTESEESK